MNALSAVEGGGEPVGLFSSRFMFAEMLVEISSGAHHRLTVPTGPISRHRYLLEFVSAFTTPERNLPWSVSRLTSAGPTPSRVGQERASAAAYWGLPTARSVGS